MKEEDDETQIISEILEKYIIFYLLKILVISFKLR